MASEQALVNMDVVFNVTAPGATTYTVTFTDLITGETGSVEKELTDGAGSFESSVTSPTTELIEVSCQIEGVTYTDSMEVSYVSLGTFDGTTAIHASGDLIVNEPYTISWDAVENAEQYYFGIANPAGNVSWGYFENTSLSLAGSNFSQPGDYTISVCGVCEGYESSGMASVTLTAVESTAPAAPVVTVSATECDYGDTITFTAEAADMLILNVLQNGREWSAHADDNLFDSHTFGCTMEEDATFQFRALIGGEWSEWSEEITIKVNMLGELTLSGLSVSDAAAGQDMTVSWDAVENAEAVIVELYRVENGEETEVNYRYVYEQTYAIPGACLYEGDYRLVVTPEAPGYICTGSEVTFSVTGTLAAAPQVSVSATSCQEGDTVVFTITAPGMTELRVQRSNTIFDALSCSGDATEYSYTMGWYDDQTDWSFSALVDGAWTQWSEPIIISVEALPRLDAVEVTVADTFAAGSDITFSWTAVENAQEYQAELSRYNEEGGYYSIVRTVTFGADAVSGSICGAGMEAGTYRLYMVAMAEGWKNSEYSPYVFTVSGELAEGPEIQADRTYLNPGMTVTLSSVCEEAERFCFIVDGTEHIVDAVDGKGEKAVALTESSTCRVAAYVNGAWTASTDSVWIVVTDDPLLEAVAQLLTENVRAGEAVTLTWTPVENAERYYVRLEQEGKSVTSGYCYDVAAGYAIAAGKLVQGACSVTITAYATGYAASETVLPLDVLAPESGREFAYVLSGGEAQISAYLARPIPAEITIPASIDGYPVTYIRWNALENDGALVRVTIPESVETISADAFVGSTSLTVCGYTGSAAEVFARVNGHTWQPLDDGEGDISATWDAPVLVNGEATFTVNAPGATAVRAYLGEYRTYPTIALTENGATVKITLDDPGDNFLRFEADVNGETQTTKVYTVDVVSYGMLAAPQNLTLSADVSAPGSDVTMEWDPVENAVDYAIGYQSASATSPSWYVAGANVNGTSGTMPGSNLRTQGEYTLWVKAVPAPGYEPSTASIPLTVFSDAEFDFCIYYGDVQLIGYNGTATDVVIPSEYEGQPVTEIYNGCFAGKNITSVTIPDGVETIGSAVFQNCTSLTEVHIPDTVTSIGARAFEGCTSLGSISLPANLRSVSSWLFGRCYALTSITIPDNVLEIGNNAFSGCTALKEVTIPTNVSTIRYYAFEGCEALEKVMIPQGVATIQNGVFLGCENLTIYGYSGSAAETYAAENDIPFIAMDEADCGDIYFTIENSTVYTGGYVTVKVTAPSAEQVRLHTGTSIGSGVTVTNGTATLRGYMYLAGETEITVSQYVNGEWLAACPVQVVTVKELGKVQCQPITGAVVNNPVTVTWAPVEDAVDYSAYLYAGDVWIGSDMEITMADDAVTLVIPADYLTSAGMYTLHITAQAADYGESSVSYSFEVYAEDTFLYEVVDGCAVLTGYSGVRDSIVVPAALDGYPVTEIAEHAFMNVAASSITLPDSVENIQAYAFSDCSNLVSITVGANAWAQPNAFADCNAAAVIYGYSGGSVEDEANRSRATFAAIGALAEGPAVTVSGTAVLAGDAWTYTLEMADAELFRVELVESAQASMGRTFLDHAPDAATAERWTYASYEENYQITLRACALVNGQWTAYSPTQQIDVTFYGQAAQPEIAFSAVETWDEGVVISWQAVEGAASYAYALQAADGTQIASGTTEQGSFTVSLEQLQPGDYSVQVKVNPASGWLGNTAGATLNIPENLRLDAPVIAEIGEAPRHLPVSVAWEPIEGAETYHVVIEVTDTAGAPYALITDVTEPAAVWGTDEEHPSMDWTIRSCNSFRVTVTAHGTGRLPSTASADFTLYTHTLDTPVVEVPERGPRHEGCTITWEAVESAESYDVYVTCPGEEGEQVVAEAEVEENSLFIAPEALVGVDVKYTVSVVANAYMCSSSEAGLAEFEVYLHQLDAPVVTAPAQAVGGDQVTVSWSGVEFAEEYTLSFIDADGAEHAYAGVLNAEAVSAAMVLPWYMAEGVCRAVVTAANPYCLPGVGEAQMNYLPLYSTEEVDGGLAITAYNGKDVNLSIPGSINDQPVVAIADGAFKDDAQLQSVSLPDSVTSIGSQAFMNATALEWIVGNGVTSVGEEAFRGCTALEYISFAENVMAGADAFKDTDLQVSVHVQQQPTSSDYVENTIITSVYYDEGITVIPQRAHYGNTRLEAVYLPSTLEKIEAEAFAQCGELTLVSLYDGVESIADDAFAGSEQVRFVIYTDDDSVVSYAEQYALDHGIPYEIKQTRATISYAEGVTEIPAYAHEGNTTAVSASLPSTLETIGSNAFANCVRLETVTLYEGVTYIADDAFAGDSLVSFVIWVTDTETVSYAEQYAIDHEIPYTLRLIAPVSDEIVLPPETPDTPMTYTVPLGEKAEIYVTGIEGAHLVRVKLGDYGSVFAPVEGMTEYSFFHVFNQLGEVPLTAFSYDENNEMIDQVMNVTVRVVGVRLTAAPVSAWTGDEVKFTLEVFPTADNASLYIDDELIDVFSLSNGEGSLTYAFRQSGTRIAHAIVDGGVRSDEVQLSINALGQLDKPVLEAEALQALDAGLTFSWNNTANTDGYVLRLYTPGGVWLEETIADSGEARSSYTFEKDRLEGAGKYDAYLMNYGAKYSQNESVLVSAELVDKSEPWFSVDKTEVVTGEDITFTVYAPGAASVRLYVDGVNYEGDEYVVRENQATFVRPMTKAGERKVQISALVDGQWTELSEEKIITVTSLGQLAAPEVQVETPVLVNTALTAQWHAVENADAYTVRLYCGTEQVWTSSQAVVDGGVCRIEVPGSAISTAGEYTISVIATGYGYSQAEGAAGFQAVDQLPPLAAPVITVPQNGAVLETNAVTIAFAGVAEAERYLVSLYEAETNTPVFAYQEAAADLTCDANNLGWGKTYRVEVLAIPAGEDETSARAGKGEAMFSVVKMETKILQVSALPQPFLKGAEAQFAITTTPDVQRVEVSCNGTLLCSGDKPASGGQENSFVCTFIPDTLGENTYVIRAWADTQNYVETTVSHVTESRYPPVIEAVTVLPNAQAQLSTEFTFLLKVGGHTKQVIVSCNGQTAATLDVPDTLELTWTVKPETVGQHVYSFVGVNQENDRSLPRDVNLNVLEQGHLANFSFENISAGDILVDDVPQAVWAPVLDASYYVVSLRDLSTEELLVERQEIGSATTFALPLTAGHRYRLWAAAVPKDQTADSPLCGTAQVEFSYRTVPEFAVTGVQTNAMMGHPVTVTWDAPVWAASEALQPDSYVVWWYGPGLGDGLAIELAGDAVSCTLPGEKLTQSGSFQVAVYACMYESWGAVHGAADGAFAVTAPNVSVDRVAVKDNQLASGEMTAYGVVDGVEAICVELLKNGEVVTLSNGESCVLLDAAAREYAVTLLHGQLDENSEYTVRVRGYLFRADAINGVNAVCEAVGQVKLEDGAITRIVHGERDVTNAYRYGYTGSRTYSVFTDGYAAGVKVYVDGKQIGEAERKERDAATGEYRWEATLSLAEGVRTILFRTSDDTSEQKTHLACIYNLTDAVQYAGAQGAQARTWPATWSKVSLELLPNTEVLVKGRCGTWAYVEINGREYFIPAQSLSETALEQFQSGSWSFKVVDNGAAMFISSDKMPPMDGKYKLVMAEGYPAAKPETMREFASAADLFVYNSSTQNFNQKFSFADDLRLEKGKTYHFVVVPQETKLSQILSYMMTYTYQPEGIVVKPLSGDQVDVWNGVDLEMEWGAYSGATKYRVEVYATLQAADGSAQTITLLDQTFDAKAIKLTDATCGYTLGCEDIAGMIDESSRGQSIPVRIQITAY